MASKVLRLKRSNLEPPIDPEDQDFTSPVTVAQPDLGGPMTQDQGELGPYFTRKYGSKHHSFWNVPWPLSYEKEILDMYPSFAFERRVLLPTNFQGRFTPPAVKGDQRIDRD